MFMRAFTRHPRIFYMAIILLPKAWDIVVRTTSGDANFADITRRRLARIVLTALGSGTKDSSAFRLRMRRLSTAEAAFQAAWIASTTSLPSVSRSGASSVSSTVMIA